MHIYMYVVEYTPPTIKQWDTLKNVMLCNVSRKMILQNVHVSIEGISSYISYFFGSFLSFKQKETECEAHVSEEIAESRQNAESV